MKTLFLYNQYLINPLLNSLSKTGRIVLATLVGLVLTFAGWSYLISQPTAAASPLLLQAESSDEGSQAAEEAAATSNTNSDTQKNNLCQGVNLENLDPGVECDTNDSWGKLVGVVDRGIEILSFTVGITALIMLIYGGFRYVISQGSEKSVATAKKTVIYSIIGLIIAYLAHEILGATLEQL